MRNTGRFSQRTTAGRPSRCTTPAPAREQGTCINIKQCPSLLNLLEKHSTDPQALQYLRSAQCGYQGSDPMVCCPSSGRAVFATTASPHRSLIQQSSASQCGISSSDGRRIVGGTESTLGMWPWLAAMGYKKDTNPKIEWFCGSALISTKYVITASHCVTGIAPWKLHVVRVGDLDLNDTIQDGAHPTDILVDRVIQHSGYTSSPVSNDIALVRLQNEAKLNDLVRLVCLPIADEFRTNRLQNESVYVAGWGKTFFNGPFSTMMQDVQIPVVDNNSCKQAYAGKVGSLVDNRVICAGASGKDSCQGDSGGPLVWLRNSTFYLVGIVSYGYKCAEPGYPGIYTRVSEFLNWIDSNMT